METDAVIGGRPGIIRGGCLGLKLPKEQRLQIRHRRTELVDSEPLPPPCSRQLDSQPGSNKCFQSGEYLCEKSVRKERGQIVRNFPFFLSWSEKAGGVKLFLEDFFIYFSFKGEYFGHRFITDMEYTSSPKPQLSSRANAFSIAALMSSGKPNKDKETEENTIKPLGEHGRVHGELNIKYI